MNHYYEERRSSLQRVLTKQDVDFALITDPTNILYFCGTKYNTLERFLALLIDASAGESRLILPSMEQGRLTVDDVEEAPFLDGEDFIGLLTSGIPPQAKIGVEKNALSFERAEAVFKRTGNSPEHVFDITPDIKNMRLIKYAAEVALLKEACRITDKIVDRWKENIRIGVSESELRFALMQLVSAEPDAEFSFDTQISSGINTSKAHGIDAERRVQPGEQVLIDFGVTYGDYHADITRTFFAGQPTGQLSDLYKIVYEANAAAKEKVKPGGAIKEVDIAARKLITEAGYGDYFTHRTGHGIGLDIHEAPDVRSDQELLLAPGMTFTIEPGIYLPGIGGIRVEDDILVTEKGCECLTKTPRTLESAILQCE
jgi:Xaa-Pro dipeptidase